MRVSPPTWQGDRIKDEDSVKFGSTQWGVAGLVNMQSGLINVCYQNSLLQALISSTPLLDGFVASPLSPLSCADVDMGDISATERHASALSSKVWWERVLNMDVGIRTANPSMSLTHCRTPTCLSGNPLLSVRVLHDSHNVLLCGLSDFVSGWDSAVEVVESVIPNTTSDAAAAYEIDGMEESKSSLTEFADVALGSQVPSCPTDVVNRLQWLFARLALSFRPKQASHALQAVLPSRFRSG
jgi:hypothetical protein